MPQNYNFDFGSAIKAGYTPDQINQFLAQQQKQGNSYQLTNTPQATPQQSQQPVQPKSNFLADALPTAGSIVGGIGGALIPGLGETGLGEIGGSAVGGAAGEGLKELIEGKPFSGQDIATQGVLGGVGGAVGKGIGYVAGRVLPKIGEAAPILEDVATGLKQGTRQIRVKPSVYGAGQEQAINATLDKYGVNGTAQQQYSQLQPTLQKIEGKIQQVIKNNPDAGASRQDIEDAFMKNLSSNLRSKDMTASQAKTEVQGYLDDLLKATPDSSETGKVFDAKGNPMGTTTATTPGDTIPLGRLRDLKKLVNDDYDSISRKILTGGDLTSRQKVQAAAWDSLDQAVKNASPEVKGLLTDESNIYKSAQSLSAARSNPPTLRLAGTSVPATVTQTGRDIGAGVANTAANVLSKTPQGLPQVATNLAGQGIVRSVARALPATPEQANQNTQNGQNYPQDNSQANVTQYNTSGNFNQNTLPPSPTQGENNSTIPQANSQTTPTPSGANPLQGYTINGQPLDPAMANLIYKVATYQLDPTKMTSLKNNERERLVSLASQFDPSYDSSQFPVKQKVREDFATGKSAQNVKAINTAIGHLSELAQTGNELGNGSLPLLNEAKNAFQTGTGSSKANNFETDADAVAGEMSNIFKATGGTDSEIAAWRKHFKSDMSPAQQRGVIQKAVALMAGRLQALQSQYTQGLGKPAQYQFLDPSSQAILQNFGIDPSSLTQPGQ